MICYELALSLEAQNKVEEAEKRYRECLEITRSTVGLHHPRVIFPVGNLARLLAGQNRFPEAEQLYEELMQARLKHYDPGHPLVAEVLILRASLMSGHDRKQSERLAHEALILVRKNMSGRPLYHVDELKLLADLFIQQHKLAEAEEILQGALQLANKRFGKISTYVHNLNIKLDDLNTKLADAFARQAGPLWGSGRPGEAGAVLRRSLDRNPENPLTWYCLAVSLLAAGDSEGHRKVCAMALQRFSRSTHPDAFEVARAYALAPGDVDNLAVARQLALGGLRSRPGAVWILYTMGLVHYRSGEHEQAILLLNRASNSKNLSRADVLYLIVLAMAHHQLGHTAEALRCLKKAHDPRGNRARGIRPGEAISANAPWWDRADYQVLLREADELILDSAFLDHPFQP